MLPPEQSRDALRRLFAQRRIADLDALFRTLGTTSPMSVFRRLSSLGYVTSYSHARRYYTLESIPEFDDNGLWQCQGVFFSKRGTLKETVAQMVEAAEAGHTHKELHLQLRVHIHNTLLALVRGKRIGRQPLGGLFVYISAAADRAAAQMARRREQEGKPVRLAPVAGRSVEIAVLLEVIHGAREIPGPAKVAERLAGKGLDVSLEQVEAIFQRHGVKKTPGPRSRSSRR